MQLVYLYFLAGLLIPFTRIITAIIHEMGHAIAALLLLKGEVSVYIGSDGDPSNGIRFRIERLKIFFKFNPLLWENGVCIGSGNNTSFLKQFIVTLSGPLASLITAAVCMYTIALTDMHWLLKLIAFFLFFSSLRDFYQNIKPNNKALMLYDGSPVYNDGQKLKRLLQLRDCYTEVVLLHQHYNKNEISDATEIVETLLARRENIPVLRIGISHFLKYGQYKRALELYKKLEQRVTIEFADYLNYGYAYLHCNDLLNAVKFYGEALRIDPCHFLALNNRGYTLSLLGRWEEAITDLDKAITANPKFAYAYNNRGLAKIKLGLISEGLNDIQQALELDDKHSYAYKNLGIYYKDLGELEKAMEYFLIAKSHDDKAHGLNELIIATEGLLVEKQLTFTLNQDQR